MQLQSHHKKNLRRISLTPLADLVFILLVFFILETSFTEFRELGFSVPPEQEQSKTAGEKLSLQIFQQGKLWVQGQALALQDLGSYLDDQHFGAETAVVIEVHELAPLQLLVNAMDQLHTRDLEKIQILALEQSGSNKSGSKKPGPNNILFEN